MRFIKNILAVLTGVVGVIYLLNPTFGAIELIPDNFPVIGNLDEAAATALVIASIMHFRRKRPDVIDEEKQED